MTKIHINVGTIGHIDHGKTATFFDEDAKPDMVEYSSELGRGSFKEKIMEKLKRARVAKARTNAVRPGTAMPVVIRNVPPGYNWGWYSREDPRMHVQSVDGEHHHKAWLEEKGKRVFQPVGTIPRKVLKSLESEIAQQRQFIEDKWVRFMIDHEWLQLHIAFPHITLVAYPNTPGKFTRKIDLGTWLNPQQLQELKPANITLNREMAALRLFAERSEDQVPYDVRLSTILWQGK